MNTNKETLRLAEDFSQSELGKAIGANKTPVEPSMAYKAKQKKPQSYFNKVTGKRNDKELRKAEKLLKRITGGASLDPHRKKKEKPINIDDLFGKKG